MTYREFDALEAQCKELEALLDELDPADWDRPTRCTEFLVRELVAHVAGVMNATAEMLGAEVDGPKTHDRVSWWRFDDPSAKAARIAGRSKEEAAKRTDEELRRWTRDGVEAILQSARSTPPERIVGRGNASVAAGELVATRVLEVGVHTMDLGHATLKGERLHPSAAPLITDVLDTLLGEQLPKALGWDARTYILTGTGRRPLAPTERRVLGPLADEFPLLS